MSRRGWRLWGIGAGLTAAAIGWLLGLVPALAETLYGRGPGPWISWALSRITGWIPASAAEVVLALLVVRQLQLVGGGAMALRRREASWRGLGAGSLRLLQDAGWVIALFYLTWGFHYARAPLPERREWPVATEITADDLERLAEDLVARTNAAYVALHDTEDLGRPTPAPADPAALAGSVERSWRSLAREWDLAPPAAREHGRPKRPLLSPVFTRMGISGVYAPWTGEAHVNGQIPAARLGQVLAHEKAHQRGIAPEDEANFLGFLVAARSDHPLARYGGLLFAQRQILRALQRTDGERASPLIRARHPGVQRDVDDIVAFWNRHRGRMQRIASTTNDLYLRGHGVRDGRRSYGRSVELLVRWTRMGEAIDHP